MKIKTVYIENFRGYKNKVNIDFDSLTAFVGKNDAGKSTILEALDIFFNEGKNIIKIDKDDVCIHGSSDVFSIGICFEKFPEKIIVDSTVETTLKDEFLLNDRDMLEVRKDFKNGKKVGTYIVANYPTAPELKDIHLKSINDLKKILDSYDLEVEDNRKSSLIRKKIFDSVDNEELSVSEIPIDEQGAKQIWSSLEQYMPLYELFQSDRKNLDQDDEVQSPVKLLIKEILKQDDMEKRLNEIFNEIQTKTKTLTDRTVTKISEMNPEIASELKSEFAKPNWSSVFKFSLDTDQGISLNKRGSGVRRLILLNFFRAEAERRSSERKVPTVIYAFEEPETSQHPEHQKILIEAFKELANYDVNQVILTTHSPATVKMLNIENLRFITKNSVNETVIFSTSENPDILKEISADLGILPNIEPFNLNEVKLAVCVEGKNDIAFLKNINKSIACLKQIIDLEREDIIFIPMGGSTLQFWVNEDYLGKLNLAQFHIYDSDIGSKKEHKYTEYIDIINTRENSFGMETRMREFENYVPYTILEDYYDSLVLGDVEKWDTSDIPELVATHVHNSAESRACDWDDLSDEKKKKKIGTIKNRFNKEHILKAEEADLLECGFLEEIKIWHESMKRLLG
ncbi:ATP-binding protein [Isobaculum melis]|uniref:Predicted ATP-dependent endonuclease of the OLD family, contains P-loop ATPase and TOPRIM domains n=1 Tax=Isobaculum melis TaxID=142588 RepID=A0A1H9SCT6_9LACT|nr:ATP-binding protein [Isobaculum melis]SER82771.1 Predicted ATP-dependent endonuclease of the OLD family, contains P-loop ATPase and TOPRIM domains [Isobaculum melis]